MPQDSQTNKKKSIVAYDYLQVHGGAEIVTKDIFEGLNFDHLVTAFCKQEVVNSLSLNRENIVSLGGIKASPSLVMISALWRFLTYRPKEEYDVVIVSGIFAPLLARNIKARKIIYYCHTPPRFLYDLKAHYKSELNQSSHIMLKAFCRFYKPLYETSFRHIDIVLANSKNVQQRLKNYLNIDAKVLYPPCDTSYEGKESHEYFLSTARLEPLKRVDSIVDAFIEMPDKRLIIMSGGSQLEELKKRAKGCDNITFTGWVNEEQKRLLLAHCEATIYIPQDEDFGMSPVESIAANKPVIGVSEGGLLETVRHLENGYLIKGSDITGELISVVKNGRYRYFQQTNTDFGVAGFIKNLAKLKEG